VGNGNIDVGNQTATRKPGQLAVEPVTTNGSAELRIDDPVHLPVSLQAMLATATPKNCGAMAQQRCDSGRGYDSAPQEFIRLVGHRDPKACLEPWIRPQPITAKR
jgi:hypothetical protein